MEEQVQNQPSLTTTPSAPPPTQSKNNKRMMVVLIILLLVSLVTNGYFVYQNYYLKQKVASETEPTKTAPTPIISLSKDTKTYFNESHQFSFDYPQNLKPYELSNGVVTFLPEDVYDACKTAHESENKDMQAFEPCYKAIFNFNGFEPNPTENYEEHAKDIKDFAKLSTFTDDGNRIWQTSLVLGQVYNFTAFSKTDNTLIKLSFQYGFNAPSEEKILDFFSQILSTFKSLE